MRSLFLALAFLSGLLTSLGLLAAIETVPPKALLLAKPSIDGLSSPQATMQSFIQIMKRAQAGDSSQLDKAALRLDLSSVHSLIRAEKGRDLVRLLFEVLNRTGKVELWSLPSRTTGPDYTYHRYPSGDLILARQVDGRWLFSKHSIQILPRLLNELPEGKHYNRGKVNTISTLPWHIGFRKKLPIVLTRNWLGLELWKWPGLLTILAIGIVIDWVITRILVASLHHWRIKTHSYELPSHWLRPVGYLAMTGIWWVGLTRSIIADTTGCGQNHGRYNRYLVNLSAP